MKCKDCSHWQGTRYSKWADCHYIHMMLDPKLKKVRKRNGFVLGPPLDPHDFKYVDDPPNLHKMGDLPKGVRLEYEKVTDTWYNEMGVERQKTIKLPYFKTRRDFDCEPYSDKD